MPTDKEQIRKAIDSFEDDNYVDSEDVLSKELKKAKNDYLKKSLDLENDVEDIESDNNDDPDNDDPDNNDDS